MTSRLLFPLFVLLIVAIVGAPIAAADPINSKNAETFLLTCDNGQTYKIVTNGNGSFTPGHVVGSNLVLQPLALTFTGTQVSTGDVVFSETEYRGGGNARMKGLEGSLVTCTGDFGTFVDPEQPELGEISASVIAVVTISPRSR